MTPEEREAQYRARIERRLAEVLAAQAITLRLCRKTGPVEGFTWPAEPRASWRRATPRSQHRTPPLPFHSFKHQGEGFCRVCGQPVYGKEGSHLKKKFGPSKRTWHDACVTTFFVMTKPNDFADILILRQKELCAISAEPIRLVELSGAEVDHAIPLYRIARDHADEPWYELLRFWTLPNLRAITNAAHKAKNAAEAKERAGWSNVSQEAML